MKIKRERIKGKGQRNKNLKTREIILNILFKESHIFWVNPSVSISPSIRLKCRKKRKGTSSSWNVVCLFFVSQTPEDFSIENEERNKEGQYPFSLFRLSMKPLSVLFSLSLLLLPPIAYFSFLLFLSISFFLCFFFFFFSFVFSFFSEPSFSQGNTLQELSTKQTKLNYLGALSKRIKERAWLSK